jgi:cytochrome c-type biogenesis protein CcmH/NrfG
MTPQDEAIAERALKLNRLSPLQVEQIQEEIGRTGRSFKEIAFGRGLLTPQDLQAIPAKQTPLPLMIALFIGLTAVAGGMVALSIRHQQSAHKDQSLAKAHAAMARLQVQKSAPAAEIARTLNEALAGYTGYLELQPKDADILVERARVYQLLRAYDLAIVDLKTAAQLKPERAAELQKEISRTQSLKAGKPIGP